MSEQDRPQNPDPAPAGEPEAVIVGIDGSPPSRNALAWAIQEARSLNRPIRLVGAYTIPSVAAAAIDVSYVPIDDSSIRAAVTNTLKEPPPR
jgi:nucleotide-binding universal stress UspA family protein